MTGMEFADKFFSWLDELNGLSCVDTCPIRVAMKTRLAQMFREEITKIRLEKELDD